MVIQRQKRSRQETLTRNLGMDVVTDQSDHEVESALRTEEQEQPRIHSFPSLGRQTSVYSLTLDEFQNTLTSDGKSFGSMNMDEFLKSIWTAEENEAQAQNANTMVPTAEAKTSLTIMNPQYHFRDTPNESSSIPRQLNLTRQGSLSVPAPLCLKTVEEVWSEISRTQQSTSNIPHANSNQREPTYGEMTLEDFLVKAGVVREEGAAAQVPAPRPHAHSQPHTAPLQLQPRTQPQPQPQLPYGMYLNCDSTAASNFMVVGCGGTSVRVPTPFKPQPQTGGGTVTTCFPGGKSSAIAPQPAVSCYGGGVANGACGTESFGEKSPVSSDGIGTNKPGRKRIIDGPVERVIERRQKRMIKNRESAARSRARKHAYTIELEAELNQLKHENAYLRQKLTEMETKSKQQTEMETKSKQQTEMETKSKQQKWCNLIMLFHEEQLEAAKTKAPTKATEKLGLLRRSFSCPF
ncbi:Protein ABSCISIC ACID-INSENSITIVE 5 [Heracleum sosnowskyi]|uniref:Protein ABSCISIC ACID-INSENSITIVE 5 n=1 Tax=Heracleum sosnowskyi TaxID=360622 RepID=A0AAD8J070_9APIA|nr:Protein ABSCISIC ACID-INSENSITIVE 5 [Heracleum sosnowskyi]